MIVPPPALAGLTLPDPMTLSDTQQRGVSCVFCGAPLSNTAACDLGPRQVDAHGSLVLWFPRCCPSCRRGRS
ncbi:MAG TPA: hypothetical protein DD420_05565 [Streptomyces sp.]|nr:hypothetical protein [Streptomyces sp.]